MSSKLTRIFLASITSLLLSGCVGSIWTGANLVYDRHNVYKKINDVHLSVNANQALFGDGALRCMQCALDIAVFRGDILLAGSVPTPALRQKAQERAAQILGYRRLFNELSINPGKPNTLEDSWITAKIRGQMMTDAEINPNDFKVVTSDGIVYLMGDVLPQQADRVVFIARNCTGVRRVVKLFRYYHLSDKPAVHI